MSVRESGTSAIVGRNAVQCVVHGTAWSHSGSKCSVSSRMAATGPSV